MTMAYPAGYATYHNSVEQTLQESSQESQIDRIKSEPSNVTIGNILRVFKALKATVNFRVEKQKSIAV